MKANTQVVDALVHRPSYLYQELRERPTLLVPGGTPDFLGLSEVRREAFPLPVGREGDIAGAVDRLRATEALTLRALPGGGLTTFANGVLQAAADGGRHVFGTSLRDVRWHLARSAGAAYLGHLQGLAHEKIQRGELPADVLTSAPCTVLVDDLPDAHFLAPTNRDHLYRTFRALARMPNMQVLVALPEMRAANEIVSALGFAQHPVPTPSPDDIWRLFESIVERHNVSFEPAAIARLGYASTTPAEMMAIVRATAVRAMEKRIRTNVLDVELVERAQRNTRLEPLELFTALDPELVAALLLERPYKGDSVEERATLARWEAYGLVVPIGAYGYGLSLNLFSEALAKAISRDLWEGARAASGWERALGRRLIVDGVDEILKKRRVVEG